MNTRGPWAWGTAAAMLMVVLLPTTACEEETNGGGAQSFDAGTNGFEAGPPPDLDANVPTDAGQDAATSMACDDGKVDPGETCDPLASCPTQCEPVGCQLRELVGGGTCKAVCQNTTLQTACQNGDGCCPPTCNATNDSDCAVTCGNGVVEGKETCDPLTDCPTSCAPLGCQLRTLQGAGTCDAACVNGATETKCVNGDQCCPPGCNATNDSDCLPGCGNNVIEKGETCDPLASCPTKCPAMGCQLRKLENAGTCSAQCVDDRLQTACINADGCCPAGCNANNDSDCKPACGNGTVEPGETCDPLASCPTSCAPKACQLYAVKNPKTCTAECVAAGIQDKCINNDGCCPKGCNGANDNDCASTCGNGIVEPGETCDPPGKCPRCPGEVYTCFTQTGSADTCNVACHAAATCGTKTDNCCPFGKSGECGSGKDSECLGGEWKWVALPAVSTQKGCVTVELNEVMENGSYEITTCAPPGQATGDGDPQIRNVVDNVRNTYAVDNDTCTDPLSLPLLAGSNCANRKKLLTMACASPSPGGFRALKGATALRFDVCSTGVDPGETPVYVWFNATREPKATVIKVR